MIEIIKLDEPSLLFAHNQAMEDPRDGLTLFGPLDKGKPFGIRAGVIGTKEGLLRFRKWGEKIQYLTSNNPPQIARPPFPGFEAVYRIPWNPKPLIEIQISNIELNKSLHIDDKHQRVYKTVELYSDKIIVALQQEETKVDLWFVIISDNVYKYCRPKSNVELELQVKADFRMRPGEARKLYREPSLFTERNISAEPYRYEVNFHHQLKARLLKYRVPTQIIRESTIAHNDFTNYLGKPTRKLDELQSAIAWHISTATFYKAGGRPWKIGSIREGVCYIGLVFKRDEKNPEGPQMACCAAQMFLDSGDGVVFKGAVGPWYNPENGDFHLRRKDAAKLVRMAVESYKKEKGTPPAELFIHGKIRFDNEEWKGFQEAVDSSSNLVGVRIREDKDLKLYTKGSHPVLRGCAYIRDERTAYLWTKGFVPRLQTYPGREVPNPLLIDICRGDTNIEIVLNDILGLTKLNYNACVFADGVPVTLKFADAVGEILTAGPTDEELPPLPFCYYI